MQNSCLLPGIWKSEVRGAWLGWVVAEAKLELSQEGFLKESAKESANTAFGCSSRRTVFNRLAEWCSDTGVLNSQFDKG